MFKHERAKSAFQGRHKNKGLEETEHVLDWSKWEGGVSNRVKSLPSVTCLGEIIIWKSSFSLLVEYNQKHQKSHQYGNHASLKNGKEIQ